MERALTDRRQAGVVTQLGEHLLSMREAKGLTPAPQKQGTRELSNLVLARDSVSFECTSFKEKKKLNTVPLQVIFMYIQHSNCRVQWQCQLSICNILSPILGTSNTVTVRLSFVSRRLTLNSTEFGQLICYKVLYKTKCVTVALSESCRNVGGVWHRGLAFENVQHCIEYFLGYILVLNRKLAFSLCLCS